MSGTETSGSDIGKAANAFSDGAGQIEGQAKKVAESQVSPDKAGRKFHEAGQSYKQALDKVGTSIKAFADNGNKLSESFGQSAKQYQSSDETGAAEIGQVNS